MEPLDADAVQLIHEEVRRAQAHQREQNERLTGRAQHILGYAGLVLGLVVTLAGPERSLTQSLLFGVALLIFLWIGGEALAAWKLRPWRDDPEVGALWEDYRTRDRHYINQQVIWNGLEAIAKNNGAVIASKVKHVKRAQRLLIVEVVYLVTLVIATPYLP